MTGILVGWLWALITSIELNNYIKELEDQKERNNVEITNNANTNRKKTILINFS